MKKHLAVVGLLFALVSVGLAGTPQETLFQNQFPMSNATILGSTGTVSGGSTGLLSVNLAPGTVNGTSCRNCFTRLLVSLGTNSTFYAVDQITAGAGTTDYLIYGAALNALGTNQTSNTLNIAEDHLGPVCFTAGNNTILQILAPSGNTTGNGITNAINYEGYTTCGGSNNAGK